jgi:hypothetical protein
MGNTYAHPSVIHDALEAIGVPEHNNIYQAVYRFYRNVVAIDEAMVNH